MTLWEMIPTGFDMGQALEQLDVGCERPLFAIWKGESILYLQVFASTRKVPKLLVVGCYYLTFKLYLVCCVFDLRRLSNGAGRSFPNLLTIEHVYAMTFY